MALSRKATVGIGFRLVSLVAALHAAEIRPAVAVAILDG